MYSTRSGSRSEDPSSGTTLLLCYHGSTLPLPRGPLTHDGGGGDYAYPGLYKCPPSLPLVLVCLYSKPPTKGPHYCCSSHSTKHKFTLGRVLETLFFLPLSTNIRRKIQQRANTAVVAKENAQNPQEIRTRWIEANTMSIFKTIPCDITSQV